MGGDEGYTGLCVCVGGGGGIQVCVGVVVCVVVGGGGSVCVAGGSDSGSRPKAQSHLVSCALLGDIQVNVCVCVLHRSGGGEEPVPIFPGKQDSWKAGGRNPL